MDSANDALEAIAQAVDKAGYKLGEDIFIALDVASSEFYDASKNNTFSKSPTSQSAPLPSWSTIMPICRKNSPSSPSKTAAPKTIGPAGRC
ncbi:MAG: hypothetical protein R3F31_04275 [Verrucomicrobiales bacterium]